MKVAITGATGFIGRPLVHRLVAEGHQVVALVREPLRTGGLFPLNTTVAKFNALERFDPANLAGCQAIIHLAGEPIGERWTPEHKEKVIESRVRGTGSIAEAAALSGSVKLLISASAIGFYGPRGDEEIDERSPAGNDFLASVCRVWEAAADPARKQGIRVIHPRIGVVLHPEGGALKRMLLPFRFGAGGRLGPGGQYMSWIHRDDLFSLLAYLLKTPSLSGPVNATAPNAVTNREFTRALGRALHRPAILPMPAVALRVALGEMADMLLTGQRVIPKVALESGFMYAFPTLEGALRSLFQARAA